MLRKLFYLVFIFIVVGLVCPLAAQDIDMEIGVGTPVIDGEVDDIWADAAAADFAALEDPADGSGIWKVLYDAENLYVLVDVTDDSLQNDSSSSWQDDSVEIYFDGGNTKLDTPLSGDDHQYTFGWTTEDIQGTNVSGYTDGIEHAQVDTDTGWRIEVKMPWMSIWGVVPQAGDLIGIDVYYNDDDDGGDSREGKMLGFSAVEGWNDASQWGTAVLAAEPEPEPVNPGSEGLVAHWPLNEGVGDTAADIVGGHDGTLKGGVAWAGEGSPVNGDALSFDGYSDGVHHATDPGTINWVSVDPFDVVGPGITLAAWIRPEGFDIGDARIITKQKSWSSIDIWWMLSTYTDGTALRMRLKTDDGGADGGTTTMFSDTGYLEAGVWSHVSATYDGSKMRLYHNAVEIMSTDKTGAIQTDPNVAVAIGNSPLSDPGGLRATFHGLIDEVRIYEHALSEGELLYLAGERAPFTYDGDALDDTWDHDNNSDAWDGTGPGEGNPGGAVALVEDDVTFLRIQDIGDPRDLGISDPSNRKIYLTRQTGIGLDGAHLEFRLRVATTPPLDNQVSGDPWPEGGIGYHIRDGGKGMVGIAEDGVGQISFSLAKAGEIEGLETDALVMNGLLGTEMSGDVDTGDSAVPNAIAIADATAWNIVTVDIVAGGAGTHALTVCVNDQECVVVEVTAGANMDGEGDYIAIGSSGTGGVTAFDVDYVTVIPPAPPAELVGAFAFGSRNLECPTYNDPSVNYTMVVHESVEAVQYDAARGYGYEVLYPVDSPYGDRDGYGVLGPFDDSPNNRNEFPDECPEELYDSFIGAKNFLTECNADIVGDFDTPCADAEGIIFRVDVPNGKYRFVGAFGEADNGHAHRILAEDGGSGPPENIGANYVVLVSNHDQSQYNIGEIADDEPGDAVFARVGFDGLIPPPGDGVVPSPVFVDMDENGMPTDAGSNSPVLEVTQGYIRIHQLQGNSNDSPDNSRDPNGGDIVILELWKVE